MDVATYFSVNQGRINEIKSGKGYGKRYRSVPPAAVDKLPPPGPYVVVSRYEYDEMAIKAAATQELVRQLEQLLSSLRVSL